MAELRREARSSARDWALPGRFDSIRQTDMIDLKKRTTHARPHPMRGSFRILAAPGGAQRGLVFALLAVDGRRP
jgi:hypothetical protein